MSNRDALIKFLIGITAKSNELSLNKYLKIKYKNAVLRSTCKRKVFFECKSNEWTKYKYSIICLAIDVFNKYISENEINNGENINDAILNQMFQNRVKESLMIILNNIEVDFITNLSYEQYETSKIKNAKIALPINEIPLSISFDKNHQYELKNENVHGIRKLIQMLGNNQCLVVYKKDKNYIVSGITEECYTFNSLRIEIRAYGEWVVRIPNFKNSIEPFADFVQYKHSQYLICNSLKITDIKELIEVYKIPKNYTIYPDSCELISQVIHKIIELGKGAIIIFSNDNTVFNNFEQYKRMFLSRLVLKENMSILENLVNIDGAIICDFSCNLKGYGAILDGKAVVDANLQRGSRYNSTLNFIEIHKKTSFGVVISDDGMIDIISK